jgi:acyl-CoA synthetase (AMP-forming)/AMP-acid ligase II
LSTTGNTLIEVLEDRATLFGNKVLYRFFSTDDVKHEISFDDFYSKIISYAFLLHTIHDIRQGERALILYPPGLDYISVFYACILSGIIAVPAYPPDFKNIERITSIIRDCTPAVILTNPQIAAQLKVYFTRESIIPVQIVSICHEPLEATGHYINQKADKDTIAFLQYTSGSTADPKGVAVTHDNILANSQCIGAAMGHSMNSEVVSWLPPYHDMGLIGGIIHPFITGMTTTLMSPTFFIKKPQRWLKAISDINTSDHISSAAPNFGFELCNERITETQAEALNLRNFKIAVCGAEPIRIHTYYKFCEKFGRAGFKKEYFIPVYGLAEATLMVSGSVTHQPPLVTAFAEGAHKNKIAVVREDPLNTGHHTQLMSCGKVIDDHEVVIVNPDTMKVCLPNEVGEIWVKGRSVALRYWNQMLNEGNAFDVYTEDRQGPFLRTGDLGFLSDNTLYISGRLKDCLIISGKKHYPQDIENTVSNVHMHLRKDCTAVFAIDHSCKEEIVAVQEIAREKNTGQDFFEIFNMIRKEVFQRHNIALGKIVFIEQSSIPKTSSGKIQRHKTKQLFLQDKLQVIATF